MKKIDKLILNSFIGPFILTFLVVVFILLMQHMLRYFDDIIGKDLGYDVIGRLLFYFAIFMVPVAMPLAVLLSSLITFGNLGEHFQLTAIKASGISLLRTLRPIFFFVLMLTGIVAGIFWELRQKEPVVELRMLKNRNSQSAPLSQFQNSQSTQYASGVGALGVGSFVWLASRT